MDSVLFGRFRKRVEKMSQHVLVAVSDGGRITRRCEVPELFKADQVPEQVASIADHYRKANGLLSLNLRDGGYQFSDAEMIRIVAFLKGFTAGEAARPAGAGRHSEAPAATVSAPIPIPAPAPRVSQEARAAGKQPPQAAPTCRGCGGTRLELKSGKYGPYFRCAACEANTPARPVCGACGQLGKVQRDGEDFSAECPAGHRWMYFSRARAS